MVDWGLVKEVGEGVGITIFVGVTAFNRWNQRKMARELGLRGNPARCKEHADAINELKIDVGSIKDHLGIV